MADRNPYPSEKQDRFIVRLPDGMRNRIRRAAEMNNRSMNAEIVATLEEKYPPPPFEILWTDLRETFEWYIASRKIIEDEIQAALDTPGASLPENSIKELLRLAEKERQFVEEIEQNHRWYYEDTSADETTENGEDAESDREADPVGTRIPKEPTSEALERLRAAVELNRAPDAGAPKLRSKK